MWQQRIIALSLLILPFLYNGRAAVPEFLSLSLLGITAGILLLPKLQRNIRITLPDILIILFFLWMGIGIIRTGSATPSALIKWCSLLASYFLFRLWKPGFTVWIAIFISGILQSLFGEHNFSNSGIRAGYLSITFLCGFGLLFKIQGWKFRFPVVIGLLPISYALITSDSRSAWCAAMAGIFIFCIAKKTGIIRKTLIYKQKQKWIIAASIMTLIALGIVLYYYKLDSANGRLFIWKTGIQLAAQAPIIGSGYESFIRNYMYAQADYFHHYPDSKEMMLADNNWYAFNEGLHLLCNWGIIGCLILACLLYYLYRSCKTADILPISMLTGLLVFSCFSYPSSRLSLAVFYLLLTAAIVNSNTQQTVVLITIHNGNQQLIRGIALIWICINAYLLQEYRETEKVWMTLRAKKISPTEALVQSSLFIHEPDYLSRIGKACFQQKHYAEAIRLLEPASHLRPTVEMLCDLGTAYRKTGNLQKAENCFLTAIDMIPSRMLARYRLFCLYRDNKLTQKAEQIAWQILNQKVKVVNNITLDIKQEIKKYYSLSNP